METDKPRGMHICIEGADGTGKSTLVTALHAHLTTNLLVDAVQKRFPSDGVVGSLIRKGLMGEVELDHKSFMYLFAADGMQENKEIEHQLGNGVNIVCDRHPTFSGEIFQQDHHTWAVIRGVYDALKADGLIVPDRMLVLDVPPEVALERMSRREKYTDVVFEADTLERAKKIRLRYLEVARASSATVLDATKPIDELVAEIVELSGLP